MASKVDICNLALTKLGASRINSLDDDSVEARACKAIYDDVADEVMAIGPWQAVKSRAALAQLSDTPAFGWAYQYSLPTDPFCLAVVSINEDKAGSIPFEIEGNLLLTDEATVSIKYLKRITDTQAYDIYLKQAIVERLMADLAYPITGQQALSEKLMSYFEQHAQVLLSRSSWAGSNEDLPSDDFVDCRGID